MNKFIQFLCNQLVKWCEKNNRVFYIRGGDEGATVYLVRYIVFKSKWGCIYIHRFMRSDSDTPHDHPWNFFTYVISGGYKEVFYNKNKPDIYEETEWIAGNMEDHPVTKRTFRNLWTMSVNERLPGSVAYRRATDVHQVVVDKERDMSEINNAPFTICLMGPRVREWGFWSNDGTVFTDWRKYLNISPNDPRVEGAE